jgi:hypothetical protein
MNCMTVGCKNDEAPALKRGLCMNCHSKAKKMIESGKTSWEELERLGLARGQSIDDPFTRSLEAARRKAGE